MHTGVNSSVESRMDLLRLVLARQTPSRLKALPRLLGSVEFRHVRALVLGTSVEKRSSIEAHMEDCVRKGELSDWSINYASCEELESRSLFLRDPVMYRRIAGTVTAPDVVGALISGEPEIQATLLALKLSYAKFSGAEYRWKCFFRLSNSANLLRIEWTPQLREAIEKVILPVCKKMRICDDIVFGFLGLDVKNYVHVDDPGYEYFSGCALNILQGRECLVRHEELEAIFEKIYGESLRVRTSHPSFSGNLLSTLVECGYVHHISYRGPARDLAIGEGQVVELILIHARYELLLNLTEVHSGLASTNFSSYAPIDRIERCYHALAGRSEFFYIVHQYRLILGDVVEIGDHPQKNHLNKLLVWMGIPPQGPVNTNSMIWDLELRIYDSLGVLNSPFINFSGETACIMGVDVYRLGRNVDILQQRGGVREVIGNMVPSHRGSLLRAEDDLYCFRIMTIAELTRLRQGLVSINRGLTAFQTTVIKMRIRKFEAYRNKILQILVPLVK